MLPGFAMLLERVVFLFYSVEAEGTVIGHEGIDDSEERMRAPKVEFVNSQGKTYRVVAGVSQTYPADVGAKVRVRYHPTYPHEARIRTVFDYWFPSYAMLLFGFLIYLAILDASGAWARPDMAKWAFGVLLGCPLITGIVGAWQWRRGSHTIGQKS